jgi:hypothetical protein
MFVVSVTLAAHQRAGDYARRRPGHQQKTFQTTTAGQSGTDRSHASNAYHSL